MKDKLLKLHYASLLTGHGRYSLVQDAARTPQNCLHGRQLGRLASAIRSIAKGGQQQRHVVALALFDDEGDGGLREEGSRVFEVFPGFEVQRPLLGPLAGGEDFVKLLASFAGGLPGVDAAVIAGGALEGAVVGALQAYAHALGRAPRGGVEDVAGDTVLGLGPGLGRGFGGGSGPGTGCGGCRDGGSGVDAAGHRGHPGQEQGGRRRTQVQTSDHFEAFFFFSLKKNASLFETIAVAEPLY